MHSLLVPFKDGVEDGLSLGTGDFCTSRSRMNRKYDFAAGVHPGRDESHQSITHTTEAERTVAASGAPRQSPRWW